MPSPPSSGSVLSPDARRILEVIDALPDDEREAFSLVRIQGADADRGRRSSGRVEQDGAAAAESRAIDAWGTAGRPPADRGAAGRPVGRGEPVVPAAGVGGGVRRLSDGEREQRSRAA